MIMRNSHFVQTFLRMLCSCYYRPIMEWNKRVFRSIDLFTGRVTEWSIHDVRKWSKSIDFYPSVSLSNTPISWMSQSQRRPYVSTFAHIELDCNCVLALLNCVRYVIFRSSTYCIDVRLSCHNKRILWLWLLPVLNCVCVSLDITHKPSSLLVWLAHWTLTTSMTVRKTAGISWRLTSSADVIASTTSVNWHECNWLLMLSSRYIFHLSQLVAHLTTAMHYIHVSGAVQINQLVPVVGL